MSPKVVPEYGHFLDIFRGGGFFQHTDLGEMPNLRLIWGETPSLGVFFRLGTFQLTDPGSG